MLEICLYLNNPKTYGNYVYLKMKYKDGSITGDIFFERN